MNMEEKNHFAEGSSHPPLVPDSLRIYAMRFCPFAQRALLVAEAKGIRYDVEMINLAKKPEWFLKLNPGGQVPTLELEDGEMLTESLIVCEYLDERYENRLHPTDVFKRAKDRFLIERFSETVGLTFKLLMAAEKPELDIESLEALVKSLEKYENELQSRGTNFFRGYSPGMLDYMIWPWFERQGVISAPSDKMDIFTNNRLPTLKRWFNRMMVDTAVKKWFLPAEVHARFIKGFTSGNQEYDFLVKK